MEDATPVLELRPSVSRYISKHKADAACSGMSERGRFDGVCCGYGDSSSDSESHESDGRKDYETILGGDSGGNVCRATDVGASRQGCSTRNARGSGTDDE